MSPGAAAQALHTERGLTVGEAFEHLPVGVVLADQGGRLLKANGEATALLGAGDLKPQAKPLRCCDVFQCHDPHGPLRKCLTTMALAADGQLPEIRLDIGESTAWVTAQKAPGGVIFSLRRGAPGDRRRRTDPLWGAGASLRIRTLGATKVSSSEASIDGGWLEHRTGQLLKFLVAQRQQPVHAERIATELWPTVGREALSNLRHCVHVLRDKLEPHRPKHRPSAFIEGRNGGYALDTTRVWIDADEFEQEAKAGLTALRGRDDKTALRHLRRAMELYGGDFLADEPYAEWAFSERDRLRDLAGEVLRAISEIYLSFGEVDLATEHLQRLSTVDPIDVDVQRQLIGLYLLAGRRSQAVRRYERLRREMLKAFGEELDFELSDLAPGARGSDAAPLVARTS
jgi:DNA-binding SARP family transcriptional activator